MLMSLRHAAAAVADAATRVIRALLLRMLYAFRYAAARHTAPCFADIRHAATRGGEHTMPVMRR